MNKARMVVHGMVCSLIAAFAVMSAAASDSVFFNYQKAMLITPASGKVSSTLANFPILVRLSSTRQPGFDPADCGTNGADLRFALRDGTLLAHEIDTWDPEGESLVWVCVPSLTATTELYALWSLAPGATAPAALPKSKVWPNFVAVYHFSEDGDIAYDSSANGYDATNSAAVTASSTIAVGRSAFATAKFTSGATNLVDASAAKAITDRTKISLSGWLRATQTASAGQYIFGNAEWQNYNGGAGVFVNNGANKGLSVMAAGGSGNTKAVSKTFTLPNSGTWSTLHYFTVAYNGVTASVWIDGTKLSNQNLTHGILAPSEGYAGQAIYIGNVQWTDGATYDEMRYRDGVVPDAWAAADYQNQATTTFLDYGDVHGYLLEATISQYVSFGSTASPAAEAAVAITNILTGEELEAGVDYELTYSNNTAIGTGQVTVEGKGRFSEYSLTKDFAVRASDKWISDDYIPVEYLRGDGYSTRILTDYTPASADEIEADVMLTDIWRGGSIWCARGKTAATTTYSLFALTSGRFRFERNTERTGTFGVGLGEGDRVTVAVSNNVARWSGGAGYEYSTTASFTAGAQLMFFASYYNGTGSNLADYSTHRLYRLRVSRSGTLRRDYIPCIRVSDGMPGLYDAVNNAFWPNLGDGAVEHGARAGSRFTVDPIVDAVPVVAADKSPAPVVRDRDTGAVLVAGDDYTVSYVDNDHVGMAKAVVTGAGAYAGSVDEVFFRIVTVFHATGEDPAAEGDGLSWASPMSWTNALVQAIALNAQCEVWLAGTNTLASTPAKRTFPRTISIRGGFAGTETIPSQRARGARSTLNGRRSYQIFPCENGIGTKVTLDGIEFVDGYLQNMSHVGAGDLVVTNCSFRRCRGDRMYTESNNSGRANRNNGGAGAHLEGTAPSHLVVVDSVFEGNESTAGEWNGSGVGCFVKGFSLAEFTGTSVLTNRHTVGRQGKFACAMQVNGVPCRFRGCSFRGNYSEGGDFLHLNGNCGGTVFENCDFVGNRGTAGPFVTVALGSAAQTAAFTNCTFAYNYMGTSSMIRGTTGRVTVHNSIFHRNYSAASSSVAVDISFSAASTGRVDYTAFDDLSATYVSETAAGSLTLSDCISGTDPRFITLTEDFATLLGNDSYPRVASFGVSIFTLSGLDVHLLSSAGCWNNAGQYLEPADVLSPMIDAGDPADGGWRAEPTPNGGVVNLGAYGGTARASKSIASSPSIDPATIAITFPSEYTQPQISFEMGGEGVYSKAVTVTLLVDGVPAYVHDALLGLTNGQQVAFLAYDYFTPGAMLSASISIAGVAGAFVIESPVEVVGAMPRWKGKGGGAGVVHLKADATGRGDGSSWTDAYTDFAAAVDAVGDARRELWICGDYSVSAAKSKTFAYTSAIRGGFDASENTPGERRAGARSRIDAGCRSQIMVISNGAGKDVTLDGVEFTRGYLNNVYRTGAGDLVVTNCAFTACHGERMYHVYGNNSVYARRDHGGAGAHLEGSSPSRLYVYDSLFGGNQCTNGEWNASGVGCWVKGFSQAEFVRTSVVTNNHTAGRNGRMACAMQVNGVPCRFRGCSFRGNYSEGGDFLHLNGNCGGTVFENCDFVGNRSSGGPFVTVALGSATQTAAFTNCTFAYNYMGTSSMIRGTTGRVTVHNSIFHRNYASTSSTVGIDISLAAASTGRVDYTVFNGLASEYMSEAAEGSLTVGDGVFAADAGFAFTTADFVALLGNAACPRVSSFGVRVAQMWDLNVHLRGHAGYFDADGLRVFHGRSPALDAGDPKDDYSREPDTRSGWHGRRVNLGAYGNTPWATMTAFPGGAFRLR